MGLANFAGGLGATATEKRFVEDDVAFLAARAKLTMRLCRLGLAPTTMWAE